MSEQQHLEDDLVMEPAAPLDDVPVDMGGVVNEGRVAGTGHDDHTDSEDDTDDEFDVPVDMVGVVNEGIVADRNHDDHTDCEDDTDDERFDGSLFWSSEEDKLIFTVPEYALCDENEIEYIRSVLSNETAQRIDQFRVCLHGWNFMDPTAKVVLSSLQFHKHIKKVTLELHVDDDDGYTSFDIALLLGCLRSADNNPRLSLSDVVVDTGLIGITEVVNGGVEVVEELSRLIQGRLRFNWLEELDINDNGDDPVNDIPRFISTLQSLQKLEVFGIQAGFQRQLFEYMEQMKMPYLRELNLSLDLYDPQDTHALGAFLESTDACFLDTLVLNLDCAFRGVDSLFPWIEGLSPSRSIKKIHIFFRSYESAMARLTQIIQILLSDQVEEFKLSAYFYAHPSPEALNELQTGVWSLLHAKKATIKCLEVCDALFASNHPTILTGAEHMKDYLITAPALNNLRIALRGCSNQGWRALNPHCQKIYEGITQNKTLKSVGIWIAPSHESQYKRILLQGVFPFYASPSTAMGTSSLMEVDILCQSTGEVRDLVSAARDCAALKKLKLTYFLINEETWFSIAWFLPELKLQTLSVLNRGCYADGPIRHERVYYELSQGMKRNRSLEEAVFTFGKESNQETGAFASYIERVCYRNKVWNFSKKLFPEKNKNDAGGVHGDSSDGTMNIAIEAGQETKNDDNGRSALQSIKLASSVVRSIDNQSHQSSAEKVSLQASVVFVALAEHQSVEVASSHFAASLIQRAYLA